MILDRTQIANLALQHIGEDDRISDLEEESRPARIVSRAWEPTRLLVLAAVHWSFAARTLELAARPVDPNWPIALDRTAFPLPADFVNLTEIVAPELNDDDDEFAIESGPSGAELLVANPGPITIRYIQDTAAIADPARWCAGFVDAFAQRLAWQISDPLAAKTSRKDRAWNAYLGAIRQAKKDNARTKPFRRNPPSDWSRARHGARTELAHRGR